MLFVIRKWQNNVIIHMTKNYFLFELDKQTDYVRHTFVISTLQHACKTERMSTITSYSVAMSITITWIAF